MLLLLEPTTDFPRVRNHPADLAQIIYLRPSLFDRPSTFRIETLLATKISLEKKSSSSYRQTKPALIQRSLLHKTFFIVLLEGEGSHFDEHVRADAPGSTLIEGSLAKERLQDEVEGPRLGKSYLEHDCAYYAFVPIASVESYVCFQASLFLSQLQDGYLADYFFHIRKVMHS